MWRNPNCNAEIVEDTIKPVCYGAGLKLYAECTMGHKTYFENCKHVNRGRTSMLDIKLSVLQLVIGLNMSQVLELFSQMGIAVCSRATLYRLQCIYVNKIIWGYWIGMKA